MPSKVLEFIGNAPKKLIGIAPFAAFAGKIYPLEQMRETLDLLEASGEYQIVLFGEVKQNIKNWKHYPKD